MNTRGSSSLNVPWMLSDYLQHKVAKMQSVGE